MSPYETGNLLKEVQFILSNFLTGHLLIQWNL